MNPKQKWGIFLAIGIMAFSFAGCSQTETPPHAPDVAFKTLKGENIAMNDLKGRPVMVTFWATDCRNCLEEIPHLINLHREFGPKGLTIIAVAMAYDPPNHVLAMAETKQLPYAVALDPTGGHAKAFGNVQLTPTSFLIDRNGVIVMHKTGALDLAAVQDHLKKF